MDKINLLTTQIRTFLAIVEEGSITNAAEMLGIGKSGASDNLRHLEEALGVKLLSRTTRRQNLTPIGEIFYKRCKELKGLATVALEEISEHLSEPIGTLRITAPHAAVSEKIAPAVAELMRKYPRIRPELMIDDERLDLVEHQIDLALTVGDLPDSGYKAQRVGFLRDILSVSPSLLKRLASACSLSMEPLTRKEFAQNQGISALKRLGGKQKCSSKEHITHAEIETMQNWPYIAHKWEGDDISHILRSIKTGETHIFRFKPVAIANNVEAVLSLLKQGAGIGIIPELYLRESFESGELIPLLPEFEAKETGIYAVHPFGNMPPLSVRTMIDVMKQNIATTKK